MLAKRIIPCLDMKDGRVVKGVKFVNLKDAGDPVEQAQYYNSEGSDELVFLDITASSDKRKILIDVVERTADVVFIPFTVGGGIGSIQDMRDVLLAGADKVSINTAAVKNPETVREGSKIFGSQCVVVAIDAKRVYVETDDNKKQKIKEEPDRVIVKTAKGACWWEVYTHGGRTPTGLDAILWAKQVTSLGAGEILLTSMDCDGTKNGYDIELTRAISEAVEVPVIASGGAGKPDHLYEALTEGKADAVLAASIFHYREYTIKEVKRYLAERGVCVRI